MMPIFLLAIIRKVIFNKRLIIEYIMIALIIAIAAFCVSMWLEKDKSEKALLGTQTELVAVKSRLSTVETINDEQEQNIVELKALRVRDNIAITGLLGDYQNLSTKDVTVRGRLSYLEQSNEAVRDYLHQPIPADLMCLLSPTCTSDKDSGKAGAGKAPSGINKPLPSPSGS